MHFFFRFEKLSLSLTHSVKVSTPTQRSLKLLLGIDLKKAIFQQDKYTANIYSVRMYLQLPLQQWGAGNALLRPYYTAKRTREILISNIHLLSPQKWSQFVHFDIEKVFPRGQP